MSEQLAAKLQAEDTAPADPPWSNVASSRVDLKRLAGAYPGMSKNDMSMWSHTVCTYFVDVAVKRIEEVYQANNCDYARTYVRLGSQSGSCAVPIARDPEDVLQGEYDQLIAVVLDNV